MTLVEKTNKVLFIGISVPWDSRVKLIERKTEKYQDLHTELRKLWKMPVEVVTLITGVPCIIFKYPKKNHEEPEAKVAQRLLQKSLVLETAHIV